MARFSSPRDALRVYFAARRGPRAARPRWTGATSARDYRPSGGDGIAPPAWVIVGRMLHAPDGCGIAIDSPEERALWRWTEGLEHRTWAIRRTEERLRELLRDQGFMEKAKMLTT